jgi:hypothetical protein
VDVGPILKVFDTWMTAGANLSLGAVGFFVMLAGYHLRPSNLDNLSESEITEALKAYIRRARLGSTDAAQAWRSRGWASLRSCLWTSVPDQVSRRL